jgi:hypothetical protein
VPCNHARDEFSSFGACCSTSFRRNASVPIRGDGLLNMECYVSDKVSDAPCWMPHQNYPNVRQCVYSEDAQKCMSGEEAWV